MPFSIRIRVPLFLPLPLLPTSTLSMASHLHSCASNQTIEDSSNNKQVAITKRIAGKRIANVNPILKHLGYNKPNQPRSNGKETVSNKSIMMDVNKDDETSTLEVKVCEEYPSLTNDDHENKISSPSMNSGGTLRESQSSCSGEESMEERECLDVVDYQHAVEECSMPTSFGKVDHHDSKNLKSIKHIVNGGIYRNGYPMKKRVAPFEVFDICCSKGDDSVFPRSPIVCLDEMEELEAGKGREESWKILRPGMVLLKSYITDLEQVSIIRKCRKLGLGPGGFYRPGYKDGAKLRLYMMCLGLDWDPQTKKYQKRRRIDRSKPPNIPLEFYRLVNRAMRDSHALIRRDPKVSNPEDILPWINPDVCIVNFYTEMGRLGLHQDRDESRESLSKGLPVVSFSIGDSAEFLYGDSRDVNASQKLILKSGDVLIFGGESRHVFHGVSSIIPDSTPGFLLEGNGLRPGRLNLTFRQNF